MVDGKKNDNEFPRDCAPNPQYVRLQEMAMRFHGTP